MVAQKYLWTRNTCQSCFLYKVLFKPTHFLSLFYTSHWLQKFSQTVFQQCLYRLHIYLSRHADINRSLSLLTCLIPYRTCLRVKVIYMQQRLGLHLRRQFSMLYDYISLNSSGPSRSRREINNDIMYTNTMEHCITQTDVTAASQPSAFYIIFFVYLSFYLSLRNFCVMGLFRTS